MGNPKGGSKAGGRRHFSCVEWFAYRFKVGGVEVERYHGSGSIQLARQDPAIAQTTGPFEAKNQNVARDIAIARLR